MTSSASKSPNASPIAPAALPWRAPTPLPIIRFSIMWPNSWPKTLKS